MEVSLKVGCQPFAVPAVVDNQDKLLKKMDVNSVILVQEIISILVFIQFMMKPI